MKLYNLLTVATHVKAFDYTRTANYTFVDCVGRRTHLVRKILGFSILLRKNYVAAHMV